MKRLIAALALLLLLLASSAWANSRGFIVWYECTHIDPQKAYFSCQLKHSDQGPRMVIKQLKKPPTKAAMQYAKYREDVIMYRFFDSGGHWVTIHYLNGKKADCSIPKGHRNYFCEKLPSAR